MDEIKRLAAMTAINDQLKSKHWSICTIDRVSKMLGINCRGESYDILSSLHCIDYDAMPPELRAALPDLIQKCLDIETAYQSTSLRQEVIDVSPTAKLLKAIGLTK